MLACALHASKSFTDMASAVSELGVALQHVLQHLSGRERQSLASTCRALRHDPRILEMVTEIKAPRVTALFTAVELAFLGRSTSLTELWFWDPASLFPLHALSSFRRLRTLHLADMETADLMPLSSLPGLRALDLVSIDQHSNLESLTTLTSLRLCETRNSTALARLTSLQALDLSDGSHSSCLVQLSQLTRLQLVEDTEAATWPGDLITSALQALQACSSLQVLDTAVGLRAAVQLSQLTALHLDNACDCFEDGLLALKGLKRLGLGDWEGSPRIDGRAVTCLFLRITSDACARHVTLPDLQLCPCLQQILLQMTYNAYSGLSSQVHVCVSADHLPACRLRMFVQQDFGQIFLELGLHMQVEVQAVPELSFLWEPDTEDNS